MRGKLAGDWYAGTSGRHLAVMLLDTHGSKVYRIFQSQPAQGEGEVLDGRIVMARKGGIFLSDCGVAANSASRPGTAGLGQEARIP